MASDCRIRREIANQDSTYRRMKERGHATSYPPVTGNFLVSRLFDRFNPGWRKQAEHPINITPEMSEAIMKDLKLIIDAIENSGSDQ